jgi:hypothetical protein
MTSSALYSLSEEDVTEAHRRFGVDRSMEIEMATIHKRAKLSKRFLQVVYSDQNPSFHGLQGGEAKEKNERVVRKAPGVGRHE